MGDDTTAEVAVLAGVLALVAERAPKLREAGVLHLRYDGLDLDLAPPEPPEPTLPPGFTPIDEVEEDEPDDPLEDGATYGTKKAPGFAALAERRRSSKQED